MRNKPEDFPLALAVKDVAEIMGISRSKVYEVVRRPDFPCIKDGNRLIIPRDAFFRWMDPGFVAQSVNNGENTRVKQVPNANNKFIQVCVEAITREVRQGKITVEELIRWAIESKLL